MTQLASDYGRYGYRRVTALLRGEGWRVNHKRIERLWRQERLKVPQKQPKRRRLWLNDGARVRLRPQYKDHVWSYDFVADRTSDGRSFRMLTLIDEHTRECLAIDVARNLKSEDVLERLSELFNGELFDTLLEAKVLVERWRGHYNTVRPHSSLGYQPPAPEAIQPRSLASATPQRARLARRPPQH